LGIAPPGGGCWDYSIVSASAASISLRAQANPSAQVRCGTLGSANYVELILYSDGSATTTQSLI
jgi:hypothetical protein